jgi:hypothetical protein
MPRFAERTAFARTVRPSQRRAASGFANGPPGHTAGLLPEPASPPGLNPAPGDSALNAPSPGTGFSAPRTRSACAGLCARPFRDGFATRNEPPGWRSRYARRLAVFPSKTETPDGLACARADEIADADRPGLPGLSGKPPLQPRFPSLRFTLSPDSWHGICVRTSRASPAFRMPRRRAGTFRFKDSST